MAKKSLIALGTLAVLSGAVLLYLQSPKFGKTPSGERLEKIKNSSNYRDGKFQNIEYTPQLSEDANTFKVLKSFITSDDYQKPKENIPHVETNLNELGEDDYYVWFGHSSYLLQVNKVKYLVDPVLNSSVSPLPFGGGAFNGSDYYKADMIPEVDYLIISHDHYDHLDYKTMKEIKNKVGTVIVPLGVGEHLEYWGYDKNKIIELDWYDSYKSQQNIKITATPARHTSGRLKVGKTLWASYVLETRDKKIFLGGDSSYGKHFKEIGESFGPFDYAIIENGQYNELWKYSHLFPEETLIVTKELGAKKLIPVHNSKFTLAPHAWYEPLRQLVKLNNDKNYNLPIITPKIGQVIYLNKENNTEHWFDSIDKR